MMKRCLLLLALLGHVLIAGAAIDEQSAAVRVSQGKSGLVVDMNNVPRLESSIALVFDAETQRPIYSKNSDKLAPIASITKLMTAMVVLDARLPLYERIRITQDDVDTIKGTGSRLAVGTELTRGELLRLALMSSENRAASALARTYPGGTRAAVAAMNTKALMLGMDNTHFVEATGLSSRNVSTAYDLVRMVNAAASYRLIHEYSTADEYFVENRRGGALRFGNTNPLVRNEEWQIGISKTGYISEAGRCLVMETIIKKRPVVIVLLDSVGKLSRIGDANRIKKWVEGSHTGSI